MDTSRIDQQITDLTAQLATAQSDLDADALTIAIKQRSDKEASVRSLTAQIAELQSKKNQIEELSNQLDILNQ